MTNLKDGSRALGIAFSDGTDRSVLSGAVVRADRVVDGFVFSTCTVSGLDATAAVIEAIARLDRPDIQWIMLAGVAPAWFNILDLETIATAADRPVISVSFEDSEGLAAAIDREFTGVEQTERRQRYDRLPPRQELAVSGETVFVRSVGLDEDTAARVIRAYTPEGGRPEPLRVARSAARAYRRDCDSQ
ncbi:endonuclease dU [Halalkalirubrum salinum]|uniref:endonuclease dU n=1 Tax=Halalkalirubrum salinum TaxID=2563889 RepID=UPI0010FAD0BB|nr:DUF99 family protein [Halalkalirubrum salinum]